MKAAPAGTATTGGIAVIKVDLTSISDFVSQEALDAMAPRVAEAHQTLEAGTGAGNDFLGWRELPANYDKEEFARIKKAAAKIQSDSEALVVIGIGGSYLGARAVIDLIQSPNYNLKKKNTPDIFFAGNTLSTDAVLEVLELVGDRDFSVNVISKSGTTTEPAVAFRIFKAALEQKYGKEGARGRIYATTDAHKGALKGLADAEGYEEFVVPDNVDGLNFLAGKDLHFVCEQAMRGTRLAHVDGGVPNILIEADTISARSTGELIYFFELACGVSGYVLGVNPFNQPGVEAYKKNMFALLDKPGYADLRADLLKRLGDR